MGLINSGLLNLKFINNNASNYSGNTDQGTISTLRVCLLVTEMILAFFTVTLNGCIVIIVAFMIKRKTFSNCLFLVMAKADLVVGLTSYPIYALQTTYGKWFMGHTVCVLWNISDYSSCTISIYCLCAISLHRWIQLNYPLHANEEMNLIKYVVIVAMVLATYGYWTAYFVTFSFSPRFKLDQCSFNFAFIFNFIATVINYAFPTLLIFLINMSNFIKMRQRMTRKKAKGIKSLGLVTHPFRSPDNPATLNISDVVNLHVSTNQILVVPQVKRRFDKDLKALLALVTITGSLVLFQSIFVVTWPYASYCSDCVNETLLEVGYWFTYVNATVNPILLFIFHRNFQTKFYILLRRMVCMTNSTTVQQYS